MNLYFYKNGNINIILNINLLKYYSNLAIYVHYVTSHGAQRPKLKGNNGELSHGELIFYLKFRNFRHISNARQLVLVYCKHVES